MATTSIKLLSTGSGANGKHTVSQMLYTRSWSMVVAGILCVGRPSLKSLVRPVIHLLLSHPRNISVNTDTTGVDIIC